MMASFEVFLRKNGLLVASLRLATALILLATGMTDYGDMGFQVEFDDLVFAAYFAWTVTVLVLCLNSWEWSYSLLPLVTVIDVLIFLLLPHSHLPRVSDILIGTAVLGAVTVLSVGLRWGTGQAARIALALNLACWANCGMDMGDHPHDLEPYVRQIVILAIISVIAIWAAYRVTPPKLPTIRLDGAILSKPSLETLLAFAMKGMNSRRGYLCWKEDGLDRIPIEVSQDWERAEISFKPCGCDVWPKDAQSRVVMVGRKGKLALRPNRTGKVIPTNFDQPLRKITPTLPKKTVFLAKIQCVGGEGVIFLGDVILPAWEDVLLFENVVISIESALERLAQEEDERDAMVHGTRESIARDLHDSVAQSLAGAKFHLAALLRGDLPPNVANQIAKLKDAIEHEHASIREYIDTLQSKSVTADMGETQSELEDLCQRLANNWNVIVRLGSESEFNPMDRAELMEVRQIIREAVANAVRHGNAKIVTVRCAANDLGMQLSISDNGIGMKPDMVLNAPKSIKARVSALRGTLKVRSRETGVELQMFIPMRAGN